MGTEPRASHQIWQLMSALGHKRTSPYVRVRSALPPKADIRLCRWRAATSGPRKFLLHSLRWSRCGIGNFDADQIRRFAKVLSGRVGRGSFVALRPATSQDRCQDGMQGLEELRSNGRRLNRVPASLGQGNLTREVWAFAHPFGPRQLVPR
jgi:hypothetical protein